MDAGLDSSTAPSAAGALVRKIRPGQAVAAFGRLGIFERAALVLLVLAAWSPSTPPTAAGIVEPQAYTSIWDLRPIAGLNVFELGFLIVGAIWLARSLPSLGRPSALDVHMVGLLGLIVALQFLALERDNGLILYQALDAERIVLLAMGYLLLSRLAVGADGVRLVTFTLALVIVLRAVVLVVEHGILGSTLFRTSSGRMALLITEDSLLLIFPVLVLWGMLVDRLLRRWQAIATLLLASITLIVDLLSQRRGAVLFIAGAMIVRGLRAPRSWILAGAAAIATVAVLGMVLGPLRPLAKDVRYAVQSSALQTRDKSTRQRTTEIDNFRDNMRGVDGWVFGNGLGAAWNTDVPVPVDIASYGSGETRFVRVGWHVYGLDWLYKLGVLGVCGVLLVLGSAGLRLRNGLRRASDPLMTSLGWSLALVSGMLLVFLFTNARLALFAGVAAGLVSKILDVARSSSSTGGGLSEPRQP